QGCGEGGACERRKGCGGGGWCCEESGESAVVRGAPSVGDGGGLEQGEVAADHAGHDRHGDEQGVRAGGGGEGGGGAAAEGEEDRGAGRCGGAAGEGCVQGAAEGLSGAADAEGPGCLAGGVPAFQQEWDEGDDDGVHREARQGE